MRAIGRGWQQVAVVVVDGDRIRAGQAVRQGVKHRLPLLGVPQTCPCIAIKQVDPGRHGRGVGGARWSDGADDAPGCGGMQEIRRGIGGDRGGDAAGDGGKGDVAHAQRRRARRVAPLGRLLRQPADLFPRHGAPQVRHGPAGVEEGRCGVFCRVQHELPFLQSADLFVEQLDIHPTAGGRQAVHQPALVPLGLQPADQPQAGVRQRLVIDIHRILRRQHHANAKRAGLLEDGQDRLLAGRGGGRGDEAEHFVHVYDRAQVLGPRLPTHPGDQLGEDEGDDELALVIGQMTQRQDGRPRLPLGGVQQLVDVQRRPLHPGAERGRGEQPVDAHRELPAVLLREKSIQLDHAQLAHRRGHDLADKHREVEALPLVPGVFDQVGEQDVLAAADRVAGDADEREQARHKPLDLIPHDLDAARRLRGLEGADDIHRHAGRRSGGVQRELGLLPQRLHPLRQDPPRRQPVAPRLRCPVGERLGGFAGFLGLLLAHPRQKIGPRQLRKRKQQVAHVALRV